MERNYNKLVRDNIPDRIKNNGEIPTIRTLSDEEYINELYKKLIEEANEVINSQKSGEILEELADVVEVLKSIAELNNKKLEDIIEIADKKRLERGGFEKRTFLEKTYSKEDKY